MSDSIGMNFFFKKISGTISNMEDKDVFVLNSLSSPSKSAASRNRVELRFRRLEISASARILGPVLRLPCSGRSEQLQPHCKDTPSCQLVQISLALGIDASTTPSAPLSLELK